MNKLLYIVLSFIALPMYGAEPSVTADRLWLWEGPAQKYSDYFEFNPSATFALHDNHYGMLGVDYGLSAADEKMHLVQDGEAMNALRLQTKSYQKTKNQSFFGEASFVSDQHSNVQWCDVEDRALLNPYIIGDSIGGDYFREAYSMGGGTSIRTGNWELGLRGLYKGSVSYRKVDPRPRNTVSSIRINPGITYVAGPWRLGWYGSYERYRQNVDIQVEKEDRKVYFFLLQGFGTYNRQFSVLDANYSRIYKGNLFSTGIHINFSKTPVSKTGLRLSVQRDLLEASESDRRTPYKITRNGLGGELTHQQDILGNTLFVKGSYDFLQTIGNETQYTPQTINTSYIIWNFATQSDRYQSLAQEAELSLLLANQKYWEFSVWGQVEARWQENKQYYYTPNYHQSVEDIVGSATIGLHCPMHQSCLDASVRGGYRNVLNASLYQAENTVLAERLVLPDYAFLTTDHAFYEVKLKYGCGLVSGTLQGGLQRSGQKQAYSAQAGLALNF